MNNETINHYYICEIVGVPKKIHPLVAWRLTNQDRIIRNFLDKVAHGETATILKITKDGLIDDNGNIWEKP